MMISIMYNIYKTYIVYIYIHKNRITNGKKFKNAHTTHIRDTRLTGFFFIITTGTSSVVVYVATTYIN